LRGRAAQGRYALTSFMNIAELIDQFVVKVDPANIIFTKIAEAEWIDILETKLPCRLPGSFRSLVTRYAFASFDIGPLRLFGNTGLNEEDDLNVVIFRDRIMAQVTLKNGYVQFGRRNTGSYDPICFDSRKSAANREFAIVRLDHEQILCNERIKVVEKVADSFFKFASDIVRRTWHRRVSNE
jgi:hypothetical protein